MKRGKDDDKMMGPMFPRLHVNDTERGGPRAPPRNKMALYEQLSVPSQRFKPAVVSASNPTTKSRSVPPASSSQSSIPERHSISLLHVPQEAAPHWGEKFIARQSEGISLTAPSACIEQTKKVGDDDDFAVPVFVSLIRGPCPLRIKNGIDGEKNTGLEQAFRVHTSDCNKETTRNSSLGTSLRKDVGDPNEDIGQECSRREQSKSATDLAATRKRGRASEEENTSDNKDCQEDSSSKASRLLDMDACLRQESKSAIKSGDNGSFFAVDPVRCTGIRVFRQQEADICVEDPGSSPYEANVNTERLGDKVDGAEQLGNSDKSDDGSETSMVDSESGCDISPDDVVAIIGQKHFWKARRAIVNQQRVFAVQVFELHRLIKVQKLIAESPEFLLEDSDYLGKDPFKAPPAKKLQQEYFVKPLPQIKGIEDSEKPSHVVGCRMEYAAGKTSISSLQNGSEPSGYVPYNGNLPPVLAGNDGKPNPWSFHQSTGHQWLIPVMSHSEGLVYKPYPGPGFTGNVGGPFGASMAGNYMTRAYGVPAPHYQGLGSLLSAPLVGQNYFPSYGIPAMNPANSGSAVDQMPGSHNLSSHSAGGVNLSTQHQSSCNLPSQKNDANLPAPKDIELQGSTASSPSERVQGDAAGNTKAGRNELQLFPTALTIAGGGAEPNGGIDQRTRVICVVPHNPTVGAERNDINQRTKVIRVVPHNPRSATASAARIFQSIQEEREQYDLV